MSVSFLLYSHRMTHFKVVEQNKIQINNNFSHMFSLFLQDETFSVGSNRGDVGEAKKAAEEAKIAAAPEAKAKPAAAAPGKK